MVARHGDVGLGLNSERLVRFALLRGDDRHLTTYLTGAIACVLLVYSLNTCAAPRTACFWGGLLWRFDALLTRIN